MTSLAFAPTAGWLKTSAATYLVAATGKPVAPAYRRARRQA